MQDTTTTATVIVDRHGRRDLRRQRQRAIDSRHGVPVTAPRVDVRASTRANGGPQAGMRVLARDELPPKVRLVRAALTTVLLVLIAAAAAASHSPQPAVVEPAAASAAPAAPTELCTGPSPDPLLEQIRSSDCGSPDEP